MALLGIVNASGAFDTALCSWHPGLSLFLWKDGLNFNLRISSNPSQDVPQQLVFLCCSKSVPYNS